MMHQNQEELIKHLCRYNVLFSEACLHLLDPYELSTPVERSYAFRPLTRQGYLKKHRDGAVTILAKGRGLFPKDPLKKAAYSGREGKWVAEDSQNGSYFSEQMQS